MGDGRPTEGAGAAGRGRSAAGAAGERVGGTLVGGAAAAALTVTAALGLVGLAEGVHDVTDVGATHRVGEVLAYAVATWCAPAAACTVVGLLAAGLVAAATGRRGAALARTTAAWGAGLGLGGTAALATALDARGALASAAVGAAVAVLGTSLWRRLPGGPVVRAGTAVVVLVGGWAAAGAALRPAEDLGPPGRGTPVVLVVADALRADALSAYGGATPTPRLDALAARGWLVDDAVSTSSWTLPAMASLWTAREPALHGVRTAASVLDDELPSLAEALDAAGYRTAAVVGNPILDPARGFAQGFDVVRADTHAAEASLFWVGRLNRLAVERGWISGPNAERKLTLPVPGAGDLVARRTGYAAADELTDDALELLDDLGDEGFLLYVHYFDPHDPYLPHPTPVLWHEPPTEPASRDALAADYAGEVAFLDAQVGRLLDGLEARGLLDDALVVFTADHGEEFLEHGGWRHRASLYDELVRLPLLVSFPAGATPGPAPEAASLVDVAPTVLGVLDLPALPGARGRDLRRAGGAAPRLLERIEASHGLASVRRGGNAWILHLPRSLHPDPERARRWRAALDAPRAGDVLGPDAWSAPAGVRDQLRVDGDALELLAGEHARPVLRSRPWRAPADGVVGGVLRLEGGPGRFALALERRDGDAWVPLEDARTLVEGGTSGDVRLPAAEVAAGDEVRWAVGPVDPLPRGARWRLGPARVALDDPRLLIGGELYDLAADPAQREDRFPGPAGAWERALGLLLDHLAEARVRTERPLDASELDRLRAMGYLR